MTLDLIRPTVDPDFLTEAFRRTGVLSEGHVKKVNSDGLRTTIQSRVGRLHLIYSGSANNAPKSVFLKSGQPERAARGWRGYRHEIDFYKKIAPKIPLGVVPVCFDATFDDTTKDFQLVLEDLTETLSPCKPLGRFRPPLMNASNF